MAILNILKAPHPILSKKASPVPEQDFGPDLERFVMDMVETMYDAPGVGLAAPQVGRSQRILVADPGNDEGKAPRKLYKMINPSIIDHGKEKITYEESCLSVPAFYLKMKRYKRIHVQWQDAFGNLKKEWFEEFPAIVIQHEMDHLQGVTLLDRSSAFKRSRYISKRKKSRKPS